MVNLNIRFQVAAALIMVILIIDFLRVPHLKTLSTKMFILLMSVTGFNLGFDMITVYTVNHQDTVSESVNMLCHQFFIGSVVVVLFMSFIYMSILSNDQKRHSMKWNLIAVIPLVVSAVVIGRKELYYVQTVHGAYSYGEMAYIVYACGGIYLLSTMAVSFNKKNNLTNYQRVSVRLACLMWILGLFIQMAVPYLLLSGLGFVMVLLIIYISFENQKVHIDQEVGGFNRNAFHIMFSECYEKKKPLYLLNIVFENYGRMGSMLGIEQSNQAMAYLGSTLEQTFSQSIYHSRGNVFTVFFDREIDLYGSRVNQLIESLQEIRYEDFNLQLHLDYIDVRTYAKNKKEAYDLAEYMAHQKYYQDCHLEVLDEKMVRDKYRQERIETLLEQSTLQESFEVYYQPIYSTKEKRYLSAEALIRMKEDEELGYISPEEFIPIAEKKGLILQIDDMVFRKVAKFIHANQIEQYGLHYIEVNLSAVQMSTKSVDRRLMCILGEENISPSLVNLEITETAVVENDERFMKNMSNLRHAGFSFSMDDFGTGYSNLSQISKTKFELIKVDKSLLWPAFSFDTKQDVQQRKNARQLLESVIHMLHNMNMQIVVEGVETEQMANWLIRNEVDYLQGYYYSRPVPGKEFLAKCKAQLEISKE